MMGLDSDEEIVSVVFAEEARDEEVYQWSSSLPYFLYEEIKAKAAELLERFGRKDVPLDVFALAQFLGIRIVKYSVLTSMERERLARHGISKDSDGFFAIASKNGVERAYIYYNDAKKRGRMRFTILHEIGHFVFAHREHSDLAEAMANFFAKYMIAPPVLVDVIQPCDYVDIMKAFDVTAECAMLAFKYYHTWRGHFTSIGGVFTEYERKILVAYGIEDADVF